MSGPSFDPKYPEPVVVAVLDMLGARGIDEEIWAPIVGFASGAISYPFGLPPISAGLPIGMVRQEDRDCIAICLGLSSGNPAGSDGFFDFLDFATCRLLMHGYVLRGAVVTCMDTDYDAALHYADQIQKRDAKFPLIVIAPAPDGGGDHCLFFVPDSMTKGRGSNRRYPGLMRRSDDGIWWFDFFGYGGYFGRTPENSERRICGRLNLALPVLRENLTRYAPSRSCEAKVRLKYVWLARRYNEAASTVGLDQIDLNAPDFQ